MPSTERFARRHPHQSSASVSGRGLFGAVVLFLLLAPTAAPAQRLPLPVSEQEAVNNAIDRGVVYVKRTQQKNGKWPQTHTTVHGTHPIGYTALPALTLLECGMPPSDPIVQQAAKFLRTRAAYLDTTYELSLAVLFLDRLGDAKDKNLIRTFALRLIAGQSATGGWGYKCPPLSPIAQKELLTALRYLNPPKENLPARMARAGKKPGELMPIARAPGAPLPGGMAVRPGDSSLAGSISRGSSGESPSLSGSIQRDNSGESSPPPDEDDFPAERWRDCLGWGMLQSNGPAVEEPEPKADDKAGDDKPPSNYVIPSRVRMLPVVQDPDRHVLQDPQDKPYDFFVKTTDNSNTQFAILALWTAQRYDVPMRRSLNLIVRRYTSSQNADGSWGYYYRFGGGHNYRTLTMTCVGLIGLAVGHGLAQPRPAGQPVQDQRIINGLIALSKTIGQPVERPAALPMENLYYLWSLERVAVLYNLPMIGDKDWYRWGAQVLVKNQDVDGNWSGGGYIGNSAVIDTCLALLFLKRVNLVKDLTALLPFTAAELNNGILEKLSPPPSLPKTPEVPKKTVVSTEPPKPPQPDPLFTKPTPLDTPATTDATTEHTDGSKKKWIIVSLLLFLVFSGGSLFFILFAVNRRKEGAGEEKQGKRKDARKKRKTPPTKSGDEPRSIS